MLRSPKPDTRVLEALHRIGALPVLGGTVARIRSLAEDPHGTTADLVAVVESDEAFSANLLRYANSAAAARPIRARTIRQAITLTGRRALVRIAIEAETYRFLERFPGGAAISRGQLHVHAVNVATYSLTCAELCGAHGDTAHLAGLLHDVGKLLMPAAFGVAAIERIAHETPTGAARAALERRRLGMDHAAAGALLVGLSDPTDDVMRAVAFHHGGPNGDSSPTAESACVQIGNAVAHLLAEGETDFTVLNAALERLGRGPDLLDEVAERAGISTGWPAGGELAEQVGRLEAIAHIDDLTGLANRRAWIETVRREIAEHREGALLICDVDGFKAVNDDHGHRTGDLVLTEIARVLSRHGIAGRLGGDEFGVWVGESGAGHRTARAIMDEVAGSMPAPLSVGDTPLGISVGVATVTDPAMDVMDLLEIADRELYAIKPGGRRR